MTGTYVDHDIKAFQGNSCCGSKRVRPSKPPGSAHVFWEVCPYMLGLISRLPEYLGIPPFMFPQSPDLSNGARGLSDLSRVVEAESRCSHLKAGPRQSGSKGFARSFTNLDPTQKPTWGPLDRLTAITCFVIQLVGVVTPVRAPTTPRPHPLYRHPNKQMFCQKLLYKGKLRCLAEAEELLGPRQCLSEPWQAGSQDSSQRLTLAEPSSLYVGGNAMETDS